MELQIDKGGAMDGCRSNHPGLGTIVQAQAVGYPDIIRKVVEIHESKLLAPGVAIGWPDRNNPVNPSRKPRERSGGVVAWYGYE